ncbi:MAG TPA: HAD family hydrolase [Xanthobacteraceae bacterium]|jgi:D-glycero-D-manno-heptose 1,7-bisphosphate phosphatase|nr:HAD family hydrolase [Xanthobacteraceae bacterium]
MRQAVFLDRDGVLSVPDFREGRSFAPRRVEDFRLYPDVKEALSLLREAGYLLVVVTNQPDIGNGLVAQETVDRMHEILYDELPIDRIETCPHSQRDTCDCRKPKPGMLLNAARVCGINLFESFMIGDRASDVEAGVAAGCKTIFIDLNYAAELKPARADYVARSVSGAADIILERNR